MVTGGAVGTAVLAGAFSLSWRAVFGFAGFLLQWLFCGNWVHMGGFVIEITSPHTAPSQMKLAGQQLIIGRAKEAQIFLDSRTISRRHAEVVHDPFGRWWLRDLGSHNGTVVNGQRVHEHFLHQHGESRVQVGEFLLAMSSQEDSVTPAPAAGSVTMSDAHSGRIAALADFESPRLGAAHLSILSEFGQKLLATESAAARLTELCKLMVGPEFHGNTALVLRASKETFTEAPKPLCEPQSADPADKGSPYISKTLLRTLLAQCRR